LLFQAVHLPAQRRLGDVQGLGGAAEMLVFGDDRETVHQPQVEVNGGGGRSGISMLSTHLGRLHEPCPSTWAAFAATAAKRCFSSVSVVRLRWMSASS
jgi:hypothetical protein